MQPRFRLYRSLGHGYAYALLHAIRVPRYVGALLVFSAACHAPTAPTPAPPTQVQVVVATTPVAQDPVRTVQEVLHHNVPFSVVGHEDTVLWLCSTQPRTVTTATGATITERDHYAQPTPCPATPIE